jgi:hypothetical protein
MMRNRQQPKAKDMTGGNMARMLTEMEQIKQIKSSYTMGAEGIEREAVQLRQKLETVISAIEKMWNFGILKFSDKVITVSDLISVDSTAAVSFAGCSSKEWGDVGKRLATLPRLTILTAEDCDSLNSLCTGVSSSKSLESIRMGMPAVI